MVLSHLMLVRDWLEHVLPTMAASLGWGLDKPLPHAADREADSVGRYRRRHGAGHRFPVRADDRRVRWKGKRRLLSGIRRGRHGRPATLFIAETEVELDRPAKKKVRGRSMVVPGKPLTLRGVLAQLRDGAGKIVAE